MIRRVKHGKEVIQAYYSAILRSPLTLELDRMGIIMANAVTLTARQRTNGSPAILDAQGVVVKAAVPSEAEYIAKRDGISLEAAHALYDFEGIEIVKGDKIHTAIVAATKAYDKAIGALIGKLPEGQIRDVQEQALTNRMQRESDCDPKNPEFVFSKVHQIEAYWDVSGVERMPLTGTPKATKAKPAAKSLDGLL